MTPQEAVRDYSNVVHFFVRKWTKLNPHLRRHKEDLAQEGFIGLLKAVKTYDPTRGGFFKFACAHVNYYMRIGATRLVGETSRPAHASFRRKETWKYDREAQDAEGNHLSVDSLPSPRTKTPEEIAILNQLARRLKYRLGHLGRDGKIFRKRLDADDTYAGGTLHGTSSASIAEEMNLSRERVRQVIQEVGEGVRAWGEKIKKEAA